MSKIMCFFALLLYALANLGYAGQKDVEATLGRIWLGVAACFFMLLAIYFKQHDGDSDE